MIDEKKVLAVIPARGGSKGLPRKNLRSLIGKPLLTWTISQAKCSKYIDRIVVSSDDDEILKISLEHSVDVVKRPYELARDESPTSDALIHVISELEKEGNFYDILVLLEPTSPIRKKGFIDQAISRLMEEPRAKSLVSVAKMETTHPFFSITLNEDGFIREFLDTKLRAIRRQDLPNVYYPDGSIYITYTDYFMRNLTFYHDYTLGFVVDKVMSFEIDDHIDFLIVESIMKAIIEHKITFDLEAL